MSRRWFIYVLSDPRNGLVRYVGVTHRLRRRLQDHVRDAMRGRGNHRSCWIRQVLAEGMSPIQHVVELVTESEREQAERSWISFYRAIGAKLTNATDGGEGAFGLPRHIVERIAEKNRGRHHTAEAKKLIGDACRGIPRGEAVRAKIAARHVGKSLSQEHRDKLALAKIGKKRRPRSPEEKAAIAEGLRLAWARRRAV